MKKITVLGSLIIDYFTRVDRFPHPGETVMAGDLEIRFGGKGANQAVAAAGLGAAVEMIACVGDDEMGRQYLQRLEELGIGCSGISSCSGQATGSGFITLDAQAENTIVVAPGANRRVTAAQIEAHADLIAEADCLLMQNEVPSEANSAAAAIARANGTQVFYNPAPWRDGCTAEIGAVDCLIVNETEAASLLGCQVDSVEQLAERPGLVVTRGALSTLANAAGELIEVAPPQVELVDTVGAGDTFVGALAVFEAGADRDLADALRRANAAAALSTQHMGAQEAMPTVAELEKLLGS